LVSTEALDETFKLAVPKAMPHRDFWSADTLPHMAFRRHWLIACSWRSTSATPARPL